MQLLIEEVRKQITHLQKIIETNDKMDEIQRDILVIDILLKIAEIEDKKTKIEESQKNLERKTQELHSRKTDFDKISEELKSEQESLQAIRIDISNNECSKLIEKLKQDLQLLEKDQSTAAAHIQVLQAQLENVIRALKYIPNIPESINSLVVRNLGKTITPQESRDELFVILNSLFKKSNEELNGAKAERNQALNVLRENLSEIKERIDKTP